MTSAPSLPSRRLGRTGYRVTVLGIGGWLGLLDDPHAGASAKETAALEAVRRAVDLGVTYFDTSPAYGKDGEAERHLGLGLRALTAQERARLRLATKTGTHPQRPHQYDAEATRWSVEQSLEALFVDRVDVLLIHDPRNEQDLAQALGPHGALEALESLKAQGVVGAIGLGVRTHRFLRRAIASGRFDVILTPYDYSLLRTSAADVIALAAAHDVGVINGSPYAAGLIAGPDPNEAARRRRPLTPQDLPRAEALWRWCRECSLDLGEVAMQYSLRNERIAVTLAGPRDAHEVEGNVRHATTPLPESLWHELDVFLGTLPRAGPGGEAE